jgi:hypothetical protein
MSNHSSNLRLIIGAGALAVIVGAVAALAMVRAEKDVSPSPSTSAVFEQVPGDPMQESQHGLEIGLPPAKATTRLEAKGGVDTVDWPDLVPDEGEGVTVQFDADTAAREGAPTPQEFPDISAEDFKLALLDIGDMRAMQLQGSAIRTDLDGRRIRIAGYVTPVGFDDAKVTDFLLVPFLGACIHVPPPPANQIVFVGGVSGLLVEDMYEPIWVTGTLRATPVATVLADVGYRLENATVEPYR